MKIQLQFFIKHIYLVFEKKNFKRSKRNLHFMLEDIFLNTKY